MQMHLFKSTYKNIVAIYTGSGPGKSEFVVMIGP